MRSFSWLLISCYFFTLTLFFSVHEKCKVAKICSSPPGSPGAICIEYFKGGTSNLTLSSYFKKTEAHVKAMPIMSKNSEWQKYLKYLKLRKISSYFLNKLINFNEILRKNISCYDIKFYKILGLHTFYITFVFLVKQ